jgi:hypothetical protein
LATLQRITRHPEYHQQDTQQSGQLLNARAKPQDFLLQLKRVSFEDIDSHHFGIWLPHPATSRGAWDASLNRAIDVPSCPDKIPKAVIIAALPARCCGHDPIMPLIARGARDRVVSLAPISYHGENSRRKLQNVVTDSTGENCGLHGHPSRLPKTMINWPQ